jgi:urease accessory protein
MTDLPAMRCLLRVAPDAPCDDTVVLDYDERLLRRKRLTTTRGQGFMVDLPNVTNLDDYWGFELLDGRIIQLLAANEALIAIAGDLNRLAWHIGNRHTPCQIEADRLLIRKDHVLEDMLARLGATMCEVNAPFTPEGGAYGTGRTFGHSHGPETNQPSPPLDEHSHNTTRNTAGETFGWHDHGDGNLHYHTSQT